MPSSSDSDVEYEAYQQALEQVWEELEYFPVPDSTLKDTEAVSFENTWQAERTYGGKRKHEDVYKRQGEQPDTGDRDWHRQLPYFCR